MIHQMSLVDEIKFIQALFNHLPLDYQKELWQNKAEHRLSDRERTLIGYPLPDGHSELYDRLCMWSNEAGNYA